MVDKGTELVYNNGKTASEFAKQPGMKGKSESAFQVYVHSIYRLLDVQDYWNYLRQFRSVPCILPSLSFVASERVFPLRRILRHLLYRHVACTWSYLANRTVVRYI